MSQQIITATNCLANEEERLLHNLLGDENELNKYVRPVKQVEDIVVVNICVTVQDIVSFDTTTGELKLKIWPAMVRSAILESINIIYAISFKISQLIYYTQLNGLMQLKKRILAFILFAPKARQVFSI